MKNWFSINDPKISIDSFHYNECYFYKRRVADSSVIAWKKIIPNTYPWIWVLAPIYDSLTHDDLDEKSFFTWLLNNFNHRTVLMNAWVSYQNIYSNAKLIFFLIPP